MRGGLLDVNILNNSAEVHSESGNGTLDVANALVNNGTIRVSGGTLTIASANGTVSMSLDGFTFPSSEPGQIVLDGGNLTVQPTMSEPFNGGITIAESSELRQ